MLASAHPVSGWMVWLSAQRPWLLPLALALAACGSDPGPPAPRDLTGGARGWNLVLLSVDTLRADRLGAYGYQKRPTSPAIDALMASGVRFDRAMAPRALTWPTLATVLTGLYPSGHGVIENGQELPDDLPTLPRLLQGAGYATAAFLSNMCHANHQGWEHFTCTRGQDGRAVAGALDWLGAAPAGQPFFLWVHLFGAHSPYYNGGDLAAARLDPGYQGPLGPKKPLLDRVMAEGLDLDERDLAHLDALYDAAVMGSDGLVGQLAAALAASGRGERTLVVFLADHGEDLYQHNRYLYHACSVYQTTLHVPLALVAPGLLPAAASVPQTVELADVAPTVLALLGLAPPAGAHGVPLLRYLARPGQGGEGRPAFSEYGDTRIRTVVAGPWKLISNPDHLTPYCFAGGPPDLYPIAPLELYDLAADPGERRNLAAEHPDKVAELEGLIAARFRNLPRRPVAGEVPEEVKRQLRALGYVAD